MEKVFGTSGAAAEIPCAEGTLRSAERRGLIAPVRDSANRRLYTEKEIRIVRDYLAKLRNRAA